jgi:hypothetical protein
MNAAVAQIRIATLDDAYGLGSSTESLKDKGYDGEVSAIYLLREFRNERLERDYCAHE